MINTGSKFMAAWMVMQMNLNLGISWTTARIWLCGLTLMIWLSPALADSRTTLVWIQDPWSGENVLTMVREPDMSLWNAARITDYEESLKVDTRPPLGILTISRANIQVPIYNGTDEFHLDRGAGRIRGMAKMDEAGNLGISGHRDGFFRGLKDLQEGDEILIQAAHGVEKYSIDSITIVPKSDISVLEPTTDKTLTLITCYPFYFVGNAPDRYIVKATPKTESFD